MAIVAGVDFGTLSVRVTLVDSKKGPIGTALGVLSAASAGATIPITRRNRTPTRWRLSPRPPRTR